MFQPAPLTIDPAEVLRYLGGGSATPPEQLLDDIQQCAQALLAAIQPKVTWRIFSLDGSSLAGTALTLPGDDIRRHLHNCPRCILMAATLGTEAEWIIRRAEASDLSRAILFDGCASAAIENLCDQLEAYLRSQVEQEGSYLTGRYSPGYGDLPLTLQQAFCTLLDTQRRIGLTVSASNLLLPRKSVTAILGISPVPPQPPKSGCQGCNLYDSCQIRLRGAICHK